MHLHEVDWRALDAADLAYTQYNARRALDEHAGELEVLALGGAWVVRDRRRDAAYYNRVIGLSEAEMDDLGHASDWLREVGRPSRVTLTPDRATDGLLRNLAERGFMLDGTEAFLAVRCADAPRPTSPIRVRRAERADLPRVFDLWRGAGPPVPLDLRVAREDVHLTAEFSIFVASVEGQIESMATLFTHGEVAWLGNANTAPAHRGCGFQQALIRHRIWEARSRGCRWALTDTTFGSTSHRNALRAGMALAFMASELVGR